MDKVESNKNELKEKKAIMMIEKMQKENHNRSIIQKKEELEIKKQEKFAQCIETKENRLKNFKKQMATQKDEEDGISIH